jgi:lipopolysaccharide transport system ATP-binding protein
MSSDLAIQVRGLGKSYPIDTTEPGKRRLRDLIRDPFSGPGKRKEEFWALRDVSFDVPRGEVIGVIGRNGAGKSTLLKILSRITEPTTGEAILRGRTGSLLEVGTGFHGELSGRENVYLNGSIIGLRRSEIERQFDEIVDFSGVGRFLDTPVKRYSSGMFVRLAFAVAAHLRTEILIVDEVLAVGDIAFQHKCLDKMREVTEAGRTVLFVSHNMGTMESLCERCLLLSEGRVASIGNTREVVQQYLVEMEEEGGVTTPLHRRSGTGDVEMTAVRLLDDAGRPSTTVVGGRDVAIEVEYRNHAGRKRPKMIANIYDARGRSVTAISTMFTGPDLGTMGAEGRLTCRLPRLPLLPGRYRVALALHVDGVNTDTLKSAVTFEVASSTFFSTGTVPPDDMASFLIDHQWEHEALNTSSVSAGDGGD